MAVAPEAPAAAPQAGATAAADDPLEMVQRLFPGRLLALDPGASPSEDDAATDAAEPAATTEADADTEDEVDAPAAAPEA